MNDTTVERFAGIDWATQTHAVCVIDGAGAVCERVVIDHDRAGIARLVRLLDGTGARRVGIERPDGPVVDALIAAGLEVVVISSRQVKGLRTRYGSAGNKADGTDAYLLADVLRTDGHRLRSLGCDAPATVALRQLVRARADLVGIRVGITNQLRAHLRVAFPGAVGLFHELDSPISLRFLERFECQAQAAWLTPRRLRSWLARHGYCGRIPADELHRHLTHAPAGAGEGADDPVVRAMVGTLIGLRSQIAALQTRIGEALDAHPDGPIFTSLPRAGTIRAAKLLAEIGDVRERFPDPQALAALAGVVPSTRQSGRHRAVAFRWAADLKLRDALCDFAGDSRHANAWAAERYRALRAAGKRHPHAERILARSWAHIIWRCWQERVPYDPDLHRARREPATTEG